MAIGRTLLLTVLIMAPAGSVAEAAAFTICGTLQALTRNVTPEIPGSATIDGRTFRLTSALSTNQTNRIDPGVEVGQRVCLSGDLIRAPSPSGTIDLMQNFVLSSCVGPNAPAACVAQLPSTSTRDAHARDARGAAGADRSGIEPQPVPSSGRDALNLPPSAATLLLIGIATAFLIRQRVSRQTRA